MSFVNGNIATNAGFTSSQLDPLVFANVDVLFNEDRNAGFNDPDFTGKTFINSVCVSK